MQPQRHVQGKDALDERVRKAAEEALADHQSVSLIDVLTGMGLLAHSHVIEWRQGRVDFLEVVIQGRREKISYSIQSFQRWAAANGLEPSETRYTCSTREGPRDLRFCIAGDPALEKIFRTHYISPAMPTRKREKLKERLDRDPKPVVFEIVRDSKCSECGVELPSDSLLLMEAGQPLCLACAGMADLEYLGAGDAALTRRSTKYSSRSAVVVRFSRSRGRYERQGILVEPAAVERAEHECAEDADQRAAERARGAKARAEQDRKLATEMSKAIREQFPGIPPKEAASIATHTAARGSGRVGRTAAGRDLDQKALRLAVAAAVRHQHTNYDELLMSGVERSIARERVSERVDEVLDAWENPSP